MATLNNLKVCQYAKRYSLALKKLGDCPRHTIMSMYAYLYKE